MQGPTYFNPYGQYSQPYQPYYQQVPMQQMPMQQMPIQQTSMYQADPPPQDEYTYPGNLPNALKLIRDATAGETEDRMFYDYLIGKAPSQKDKEVISSIRDDEIKHFSLFRRVYTELTGAVLPPPGGVAFEQPASYCAGIRKALMGELGAVRRYRTILFAMQSRVHINILTEIITDELRHASLYNYLYARNECRD